MQKKNKSVHFVGIGGSGASAVAQIAKYLGFEVSGCDLNDDTPYIHKVRSAGIPVTIGHDQSHVDTSDIIAVSPAVFYLSNTHPEIEYARSSNKLVKWQEFLGLHLHSDKKLICVAGTHGKSTTTAMVGHLLEDAGLDPIVELGATDLEWGNNIRLGSGQFFVSEADEFHNNFASYHPDYVILNNIELDHPEFFGTLDKVIDTFLCFVRQISDSGALIYNSDDANINLLVSRLDKVKFKLIPFAKLRTNLQLSIPGKHNLTNAAGVIALAEELGIKRSIVLHSLKQFIGLSRRIELIGKPKNISIFDDYANHPTAFAATLEAIRSINPQGRIIAVIEPHTVSRLRATITQLADSLQCAYFVIITDIFTSREQIDPLFTGQTIADSIGTKAEFLADFQAVSDRINQLVRPNDAVVVMGSGDSHKLSRLILSDLSK